MNAARPIAPARAAGLARSGIARATPVDKRMEAA